MAVVSEDHYLRVNRANWDERAPAHVASPDYAVAQFVADPGFLSGVVRFDRPRLGELAGLDVVHLQCHIGTDTLSLARLGARVTGLDFSAASLVQARRLAERTGAEIWFVESDVHRAPEVLGEHGFDLVYTGIGALCWLPDIARWARTVAALLRPGGRLFVRDGHPMLFTIDETDGARMGIEYPYFERIEPLVFDDATTYVQTDAVFTATQGMAWSHGIAETITALQQAGLEFVALAEHDSVP